MHLLPGAPENPGAQLDAEGANFALFSTQAEAVELCLFDAQQREISRHPLFDSPGQVWHGYLPACQAGQIYGFRVHGPWNPAQGLRCNPAKLLLDPYARQLKGTFQWHEAVFDYQRSALNTGESAGQAQSADPDWQINTQDSAPYVQKAVVTPASGTEAARTTVVPWAETIIYECNLRGYTMRFPGLDETRRGRFSGMAAPQVLAWIKALGVTSIELQPVQAFIDEHFLAQRGLRNFWGYNSLAFFAPEPRYAGEHPLAEFSDMVNRIHDAGLEVILDVAFNHTAESDSFGPTLSFRGIDNLSWYRTEPHDRSLYVNDTGCGNTLNADHPRAQDLVVDALHYWANDMGVDGFRFDLATILGRHETGFQPEHPLLQRISWDPRLKGLKLIAEPWDPGPGGYHLGRFPAGWAEWNDKFRDSSREFWRGRGQVDELARRIHGSADLFETVDRAPWASVNFVTSHDGFSLHDLVSYQQRHNHANGEGNRDGHAHNLSCNYGIEGPSDDPAVLAARRQHRLNLLCSLLLSQGTPMLLAGDEFGNSQGGNNNAYAQDNETGWLDWSLRENDPDFTDSVRALLALRRNWPIFRQQDFVHNTAKQATDLPTMSWFHPDGADLEDQDWAHATALMAVLADGHMSVALLFNSADTCFDFQPPGTDWAIAFASSAEWPVLQQEQVRLPGRSSACLVRN